MTRVVVTGAGGPAAVSFMRAVAGDEVAIYAGDPDPYAPGLYLVPESHRWILRCGDDPRFVDDLLERCARVKADALVPTVDAELLAIAHRREDFERNGTRVMLAPTKTLEFCLDKWSLVCECTGCCPVPETSIVDEWFTMPDESPPLMMKPRRGAGARGVRLVTDASCLCDWPRDGTFLAQECLTGAEYSVDVLCAPNGDVLAAVPRSRLKIDSGVAVVGRTVRDQRLETLAGKVAQRLGVTYVANIQFREDQHGTPKLLDVNARFPGTMPLTIASGVDMPRLALDLLLDRPVDEQGLRYEEVAVVRTWQEHAVPLADLTAMEARAKEASEVRLD